MRGEKRKFREVFRNLGIDILFTLDNGLQFLIELREIIVKFGPDNFNEEISNSFKRIYDVSEKE